jgi:hypothetical protein
VPHGQSRQPIDPGTRLILEELRDLRVEMRAGRRQAAADRQQAAADRQQAAADRLRFAAERRQADERFEQLLRDLRQDGARREVATQRALASTQRAFRDIRAVGLSIVKTLNRHTRILERIDRKLGARGNGHPGHEDGRGA